VAVRLRVLLLVAAAAVTTAVYVAPSANAGLFNGNCPSYGSPVFAPWNDSGSYYLASNGGFENGSTGWSLSGGASVVSGNEPFYASGWGSHSLSLPSGSTATSPAICLGPSDIYIRMFGADANGSDNGLHVRVVWYGLLNVVLGITDFDTYAPGSNWAPTDKLSSGGGLAIPLVPLLGSTSARVQLTPIGSGSDWHVDDFFVDPWTIGA
jgi:hypothetical protein